MSSHPHSSSSTPTIDVVVEIPKGSRNKYEVDKDTGVIRLDRRLFSATVYPADYGFIPDTLAGDGDALDAMVLLDDPTFPGCWIRGRPVAVLWMEDDKGEDAKIVCVPAGDPRWATINDLANIPGELVQEIQHFFEVYKMIEPDKHSSTRGWGGAFDAWEEIRASQRRYTPTS